MCTCLRDLQPTCPHTYILSYLSARLPTRLLACAFYNVGGLFSGTIAEDQCTWKHHVESDFAVLACSTRPRRLKRSPSVLVRGFPAAARRVGMHECLSRQNPASESADFLAPSFPKDPPLCRFARFFVVCEQALRPLLLYKYEEKQYGDIMASYAVRRRGSHNRALQ
eukprot:4471570-Pleurochrysis_carterae.AAC.1